MILPDRVISMFQPAVPPNSALPTNAAEFVMLVMTYCAQKSWYGPTKWHLRSAQRQDPWMRSVSPGYSDPSQLRVATSEEE